MAKEGLHSLEQILKTKARHPNQSRPWVKIMGQEGEGGKEGGRGNRNDESTSGPHHNTFSMSRVCLVIPQWRKISLRITATYRRPTASLMVTWSLIFSSWTI